MRMTIAPFRLFFALRLSPQEALADGRLRPGGLITEGTAGSTGISLALQANVRRSRGDSSDTNCENRVMSGGASACP